MGGTKRLKLQAMQQVLEVYGSRFRFIENGSLVFECQCGHGRNGFSSDKKEGDGKTPLGNFEIESAFGFETRCRPVNTSPITPLNTASDSLSDTTQRARNGGSDQPYFCIVKLPENGVLQAA